MIPFPDKKYQIIYADPPWSYARKVGQGIADKQYDTMPDQDIYDLPVSDLAEKDCALICWVTFPKIVEGITAIQSWGFEIKTLFASWIKTNKSENLDQLHFTPRQLSTFFGIGCYTKSNCEVCLLATHGNMAKYVKRNDISSVVLAPIGKHSAKPKEVKKMITDLFGELPRIELFARQETEGWDVWGNEVNLPHPGGKG